MVASPAAAAVVTDVLWCLGLGLLLALARDALGLIFGNGRVLCFAWDLLAFVAGAVLLFGFSASASASGVVRWYMAGGMAAGALGWNRAGSGALHGAARALVRAAGWPFRVFHAGVVVPLRRAAGEKMTENRKKRAEKRANRSKKPKKQLQKAKKILYN